MMDIGKGVAKPDGRCVTSLGMETAGKGCFLRGTLKVLYIHIKFCFKAFEYNVNTKLNGTTCNLKYVTRQQFYFHL